LNKFIYYVSFRSMKTDDAQHSVDKEAASDDGAAFSFDPSVPLENANHERFCLEVMNRKPLCRAYQLAFPDASYNSARGNSCRLMAIDGIQARIEHLKEEQQVRLKSSSDDILRGLEMARTFDPADLYSPDGTLIPIKDLPPEVRMCIERVEVDEITIGEGKEKRNIGQSYKIHMISKRAAYEMLGKHHKLFTDRIVHEHKFSLEEILGGPEDDEVQQ
jgi:hypothetical protein